MKENFVSWGRWIFAGLLLVGIGALMITGLGRKRGTRSYRLRMTMWAMLIGFTGGAPLAMLGCDTEKDEVEERQPTCYAVEFDAVQDLNVPQEDAVMCYLPRLPDASSDGGPDVLVTCYKDAVELPQVMCYDPALPDIKADPPKKDIMEVCYGHQNMDVQLPPPDVQVMCYEDVSAIDVPPVMCYDPAMPDLLPQDEDIQKDEPDVPGPTCYAPPPPD